MTEQNQTEIRKARLPLPEPLLVILANILVFGLAFLMLRLSYQYSLACVALVIVALLYMDKKD